MFINYLIIVVILAVIVIIGLIAWSRRGKQAKDLTNASQDSSNNNQVYIGNLAYGVSEMDLRNFFQGFGTILEIRIVKNSKTGRSKGFAFITYKNTPEADQALIANGKQLQNRRLVVRIAKPRA